MRSATTRQSLLKRLITDIRQQYYIDIDVVMCYIIVVVFLKRLSRSGRLE